MTTLLVAHGTRNPRGVAMIGDLAHAMSQRLRDEVRVGFVDVLGPDPAEAISGIRGTDPVRVVPAFLPAATTSTRPSPLPAPDAAAPAPVGALGPDAALADAMVARLLAAGWQPGDEVVMAAAGSRDLRAQGDVAAMGGCSQRVGAPVRIGFVIPAVDGSGYPRSPTSSRQRAPSRGRAARLPWPPTCWPTVCSRDACTT